MLEMESTSARMDTGGEHDSKLRAESLGVCDYVSMEASELKSKQKQSRLKLESQELWNTAKGSNMCTI